MALNHGSLFSGIGGFDLGAQWLGWENVFQVEIDDWCRKVLAKNFPSTKRYSDIYGFNGYDYANKIDVISGGFPCQSFSVTGKRKGKADDRYLWPEMLRVINEIKPAFVVGENVTGIISLALDTVLSDLENSGYTTEAYIIPACGKNAWHRRDRVWIVAYSDCIGWQNDQKENRQSICNAKRHNPFAEQNRAQQQCRTGESGSIFPNPTTSGFQDGRSETMVKPKKEQKSERCDSVFPNPNLSGCEKQRIPIPKGKELFAPKCESWWEVEPGMDRVVDGLPHRVDRLKGLGNAVVPQVVYEIFSAINDIMRSSN